MDLKSYLPDKKAFTALLVGSILAIMIGAILLIVSYVVISSVMGATLPAGTVCVIGTSGATGPGTAGMSPLCTNGSLNTSLASTLTNIAQALNIAGIGLIVAGIAGIIYMLIGLGGQTGRGR